MWERLLAALVAVVKALEPYFSTFAAFMAGKGVAEFKAMQAQLEKERAEREYAKAIDDWIAGLPDDELRDAIASQKQRLRAKARLAGRRGGNDD